MRRMKAEGFTLLEVAIAGAILLMGMLLVANVTRTVLDSTAPDSSRAAQNGPVIDQYLRAEVALIKGARDGSAPTLSDMPYGNGTLHVPAPTVTPIAPLVATYTLTQYQVKVEFLHPPQPAVLVAQTTFWKLWRDNGVKAGI